MGYLEENTFDYVNCNCGGIPKIIEHESLSVLDGCEWSIVCDYCGLKITDIELSEVVKYWNKANEPLSEREKIARDLLEALGKHEILKSDLVRDILKGSSYKTRGAGFIYIGNTKGTNNYKIGSTIDIENRIKQLKTGNHNFQIIATRQSINRFGDEKILHKLYSGSRISGEWFNFNADQLAEMINTFGFNYHVGGGL